MLWNIIGAAAFAALVLLLVCNALCILLAFGLAHCNRAFAKGICKEQY